LPGTTQEQCQSLFTTSFPESIYEDSIFSKFGSSAAGLEAVNGTRDDTGYRALKGEINSGR